jgi:DNA helicase HerA-like ATPase
VEEAHRYLSEERPPSQRGDRTLLELAIAEARRYGWGFVILDQMPVLLSRYVWDNMGTVVMHRLTNVESFERVKSAIGDPPNQIPGESWSDIAFKLPEDLCVFRSYLSDIMSGESSVGLMRVPRMKQ